MWVTSAAARARKGICWISWNGVDEDCDGVDFNGMSCAEDAAEDALAYISYYSWNVSDSTGNMTLASWAITNQILYVDYESGKAVNVERDGESSTELAISMDTFIQMNQQNQPFYLDFDVLGGTYVENCYGYVPWMDLKFQGEISIAVNGNTVDSTVKMSAAWDGLIQDDMVLDSGCNLSTLSFIWDYLYGQGYIPYSNLLGFIDNSYQETADALADVIESEVKWFIDYECGQ